MKLFCAIVGVAESAFDVDIAEDASVFALKNAIRAEPKFGYPNSKLRLFLAKSKEGEWLDGPGATAVVSDDLQHFTPMNLTLNVGNDEYFGSNFHPGEGQVHVLVEISEMPPRKKQRVGDDGTEQILPEVLDMMKLGQSLNRDRDLAPDSLLRTPTQFIGVALERGLYVRQEYWDVYKILNEKLAQNKSKRVLMIGSPGIGKSVFGVFLLLLFMSEHKNVAYRPLHGVNEVYYFTWDAVNNKNCYKISLEPVSGHRYEGLFDGNDDGNAWYLGFEHSYLFASPRTDNYNAFVKERCATIYMNPWTTEECKKYVDKLGTVWPSIQPGLDTHNAWFMRYNLVGGKPRLLFSNSLDLKCLVQKVEIAIPAKFEELKTAFQSIERGSDNDKRKHLLFALFRDEKKPGRYAIDFVSGTIKCKVSARFNSASMDEINRNCMTSNPLAQAWRGHICERFLLENAGTSKMLVRALEREGTEEGSIESLGPFKASSEMIQEASEIVAKECVYRPVSNTFPSIDGVLVVPRQKFVIYLQTTVSLRNSIQHDALKKAINTLVTKQGFGDYMHIFLFLVEADTYDQFKQQKFRNKDNEECKKDNDFEVVVTQYVGKIEKMINGDEAHETGSAAPPSSQNRRKCTGTSSKVREKESGDSSSEADTKQHPRPRTKNAKPTTKQRRSTKNPKPIKRGSSSSRSKKDKTSN